MDVRSKKQEAIAHSEDQEDELLSIVAIRGCVYNVMEPSGIILTCDIFI